MYHVAGKFGSIKVWQIYPVRAFGEKKIGKLIDQLTGY